MNKLLIGSALALATTLGTAVVAHDGAHKTLSRDECIEAGGTFETREDHEYCVLTLAQARAAGLATAGAAGTAAGGGATLAGLGAVTPAVGLGAAAALSIAVLLTDGGDSSTTTTTTN